MTGSKAFRARRHDAKVSAEEARLLVDSVVDYAIYVLDVDGHVVTWNPGAARIKGYSAEEIVGQHVSRFYVPTDVASERPALQLATALRLGRAEEEGWRVRKDGSLFWASVIITCLRDEHGEHVGFAKITRDLGDRRDAEEALRRSEERFRLLVDAVVDYAIYMLDPDGRVTTWNLGAERMKGYATHEILGRSFSVFFPEEERLAGRPEKELATAREQGRFEEEGWRVRKDGSRFWANVVLSPVLDARRELIGFAKVTRDLTLRRQSESVERELLREQAARTAIEEGARAVRESELAALRAAQHAEEASRAKDEFLATVSHEIRTPLNAMLGWSTVLSQRPLEPADARGVQAIRRAAEAQVRIVDDILDVSRIVTGKLHLDLAPLDLVVVLHEAIDVVRPSAAAKGIAIQLVPEPASLIFFGDAERLRQVAWNLLSNAVKFTDPGGHVRVSLGQEGSSVALRVGDDGHGIAPEFLPYVFDRFVQADGSSTRRFGGLGLGLALVRHIVELHGGVVQAESEGLGKGASFGVTLPIRALLAEHLSSEGARRSETGAAKRGEDDSITGVRVLVVDDDDESRQLLADVLARAGAVVETADRAAPVLGILPSFRPHVLVSDVGMPGEDGHALMRRIRAGGLDEGGDVPAIALTAYARAEDETMALDAGFTMHLCKPVVLAELVRAVASLASFRRTSRPPAA